MNKLQFVFRTALLCAVLTLLPCVEARAHCDTMNGPVIAAARAALEKDDVTPVLKWVKKEREAEIRDVFKRVLAVRKQSAQARELADRYFYETLVRIHRAGEGAPYTGLKPAGTVEPAVAAADKALESGSVDALVKEVTDDVGAGIRQRFARAVEAKKRADDSVDAGREFVEAYVTYVHYVEGLHHAADSAAHGHYPETEHGDEHKD